MYEAGRFRVGNSLALVQTNDEGFAEAAGWAFRDLGYVAVGADSGADLQVVDFEVLRRTRPWVDWGIWRDGEPCETTLTEGYVLFHLQWEFNRLLLERPEPALHAAAVQIDGKAIVLCGSSTSGKTTFAGWLTSQGAGYLADEVSSLSADATTISTFPRPLGLRHGGPLESLFEIPESFEKRFADYEMLVPASEFGHIEPQGSYPIGAIVLPQYLPDQVTELAVLSPSAAHEAVCQSAPGLIERGRETFVLLADLVRRVPTVKLTTNGLDHAGELLESYLLDSGVVAEGTLR
jgi:hypothetical protein